MNASKYLEEGLGIKIDKNIKDMINDKASFMEFPSKHIASYIGIRAASLSRIWGKWAQQYNYINKQKKII